MHDLRASTYSYYSTYADCTAPSRDHKLDHTDHLSALKDLDRQGGIDDLSDL